MDGAVRRTSHVAVQPGPQASVQRWHPPPTRPRRPDAHTAHCLHGSHALGMLCIALYDNACMLCAVQGPGAPDANREWPLSSRHHVCIPWAARNVAVATCCTHCFADHSAVLCLLPSPLLSCRFEDAGLHVKAVLVGDTYQASGANSSANVAVLAPDWHLDWTSGWGQPNGPS
jgi:hypothetical protein